MSLYWRLDRYSNGERIFDNDGLDDAVAAVPLAISDADADDYLDIDLDQEGLQIYSRQVAQSDSRVDNQQDATMKLIWLEVEAQTKSAMA